jgi:archaellum component FlaC
LDIDNNAEVVATMTVSEICQAVADDKSKLAEEIESNCTSIEEEILEVSPTNAQMREALRILSCGVQHRNKRSVQLVGGLTFKRHSADCFI